MAPVQQKLVVVAVVVLSTLVGLSSCRVNDTCVNSKLDGLHNVVVDNFEGVAALKTVSDAKILSYSNESAEILLLYAK